MKRPRSHRRKGAHHRSLYALVWSSEFDCFVRFIWFGHGDYLLVGLDNEVLDA